MMGIYRDRQKKIEADQRPLTDETLEELGFKKSTLYEKYYYFLITNDIVLETKKEEEYYTVTLDYFGIIEEKINWKTVGSVRMLIEALKGDE